MSGLYPLGGGSGGSGTPAAPLLSYQYNEASAFTGGELTRQSSTVTSLGLDSATPAAMTLRGQNSRGGTDTDVAGGDLIVASGAGTGNAAVTSLLFKTPTVAASGSSQQALATRLTVNSSKVASTTPIINENSSGPVTAITPPSTAVGMSYLGNFVGFSGDADAFALWSRNTMTMWIRDTVGCLVLPTMLLGFASLTDFGSYDAVFARLGAGSIRQGLAPSATPVAQTYTLGEASRPGTDTDVGGASGTLRSGLGTGTGTASSLIFQTPTLVAAGSTTQTYATRFTVATASVAVAAGIPLQLGTWTTAGRPSAPAAGMLGWNTTIGALDYYDGSAWTQSSTAWTVSSNNLVPSASNSYDLGDGTHIVRSLYLGTSAILSSACTVEWNADLGLARLAAASLRLGLAPSATPVAQTLTVGESSRPATDTNVGGSNGTIRSGLGTGTGTASSLIFQTALVTGSGSGVQSYDTKLTLSSTAATFTQKIVAIDAVGILFTSGDVGLGRSAAGLLEINSGSAGTLRDLTLRTLKYSGGVTVSVTKSTMSGNLTIAATDPVYNFLDPNGANRDVTLPGSPPTGMSYLVKNTGAANTLTVKNNGGSTLATLAIGDIKTFVYDGAAWQVL